MKITEFKEKMRGVDDGVLTGAHAVPKRFRPNEALRERFPAPAPLDDPPYKGPTARKRGDAPTVADLSAPGEPPYKGLLMRANNYHLEEAVYCHHDGTVYDAERGDALMLSHDDAGVRILMAKPAGSDEWRTVCRRQDILLVNPFHTGFKRVGVGTLVDSLVCEAYHIDFIRTDIFFDRKAQRLKYGNQLRAVWNGATGDFQLFRNNRPVDDTKDILYGLDVIDTLEAVVPADKVRLFQSLYYKLGQMNHEMKPNLGRALRRFRFFNHIEVLYNADLPDELWRYALEKEVERHAYLLTHHIYTEQPTYTQLYRFRNDATDMYWRALEFNLLGRNPSEILVLPKWLLRNPVLTNTLLGYPDEYRTTLALLQFLTYMGTIDSVRHMVERITDAQVAQGDGDMDRPMFHRGLNELLADLLRGHMRGHVTDAGRLIEYLTFDLKFTQGIDDPREGWNLLTDYYEVCRQMEIAPIRYPASLKLTHDVASYNLSQVRQKVDEEAFARNTEMLTSTVDFNYRETVKVQGREVTWQVIPPSAPVDLVQEGSNLNHCVGSYVAHVVEGTRHIVFMRAFSEDEPEGRSLLTIELRPVSEDPADGFVIHQSRGQSNRNPEPEEKAFLDRWRKKSGIEARQRKSPVIAYR